MNNDKQQSTPEHDTTEQELARLSSIEERQETTEVLATEQPVTQPWQTKEQYDAAQKLKDAPVIDTDAVERLNHKQWNAAILQGIIVFLLIIVHATPIGHMLPTIMADSGSRAIPASPAVGLLYLSLLVIFCFQVAFAMNKRQKQGKKSIKLSGKNILFTVFALIGISLMGGGFVLIVPLIALALIFCNFTTCYGT